MKGLLLVICVFLVLGGQLGLALASTPEDALMGIGNILIGIFWLLWVGLLDAHKIEADS